VVSFKPGGGFQQMSGTSMASPHVAGFVVCLLNTVAGGETSQTDERLRKVLDPFALDIGIKGPDNAAGLGFLTYLSKPEFDQVLPKIMQQLIPATVA
jgi:subtilisin family serine protease